MIKEEKKELLLSYINNNIAPILIDFIDAKNIPNCVVLEANCDKSHLNGHYDGIEFNPPEWLELLIKNNKKILVINNIDSINKEEQNKFIEIIKYRKVSTYEIPSNVLIVITAKNINKNTIADEIYSLVAHIKL